MKNQERQRLVSPLPSGEVGAKRRVRGYGLSIDRNPSPHPSPDGRGSTVIVVAMSEQDFKITIALYGYFQSMILLLSPSNSMPQNVPPW
jgi:hypothetical protein